MRGDVSHAPGDVRTDDVRIGDVRIEDEQSIRRLPIVSLALLAVIGFVLVAMETMPAGLLPVIATGMGTSEGTVGLFVSAYALGTVIVTIPAISLTRGMRRKPLILTAILGLVLANTVTAVSTDVTLSLITRFVAGAFSGIIWGMLAAYGRKISPPRRAGLALSIVSTGAPVGFALGTPLGSWLGTTFDWRWAFVGLTAVAIVAGILIAAIAPDADGQAGRSRLPVARVLRIPGILPILAVIFAWMLAHNTIYTYISPYLRTTGSSLTVDVQLFIFGIASIAGIVITGALLDRYPRPLLHGSVILFIAAGLTLLVGHTSTPAIIVATVVWGITFGGAAAQLQAALTTTGGDDSDVANSFLPVAFNLAIFAAGIVGAALVSGFDGLVLPVVMIFFGAVALVLTQLHVPPSTRRRSS
ncbi:putative MFS family arabinose efflux permease [Glaciihabitans tibetensis]|uniref:Putative MFS family arabinose efflux permease n=1 Tax=Glaciihabitans tibetensis TaxID=1266600 RepID=A0A2T0V2E4_9MICO|nr:MFS transporter [Glaciihabitans tibetensis]PRY64340.1 putative MFS family arabinose efflux permease [Glaciihabitans tibetensis]